MCKSKCTTMYLYLVYGRSSLTSLINKDIVYFRNVRDLNMYDIDHMFSFISYCRSHQIFLTHIESY